MPVGGDALKATNKIGKFALKNADDIGIYAEILSFANKNFPDAVKKLGKNDEFVLATNKVSELGEKKITKKQYQEMLKSWTQAGIENAFEGGNSSAELKEVYNSIKDSPNYPEGFQPRANGTTSNKVNNQQLLEKLREIESGTWKKVYKDGYDAYGNKISIHYFQSQSGKVFNVKVKSGWSN